MMDLGRMQPSAAAATAKSLSDTEATALKVSGETMLSEQKLLKAAGANSSAQANSEYNSIMQQAKAFLMDSVANIVSGASIFVAQGAALLQNLSLSGERAELETQVRRGSDMEEAIQAGLDRPVAPGVGAGAAPVAASAEQRARLRALRETTTLERGGRLTDAQKEEITTAVAAAKNNAADRETISQSIDTVRSLKANANKRLHIVEEKMSRASNQAQAASQLGQMAGQAVTAYMKVDIETLRAKVEKTKTLLQYAGTVYQHWLQVASEMYRQNIDRAKSALDTQAQIAAARPA